MAVLTWSGILRGGRGMFALGMFAIPFGIAFGVAATERGLDATMATVMSFLVFAGASQFAALEFWTAPVPIIPLLLAVLALNARHVLLGAALHGWMRDLPAGKRYAAMTMMTDANWAYALPLHRQGEMDVGVMVGAGAIMWIAWVIGTALGASLSGVLIDPSVLAFDTVMVAFFSTVLVTMARGDTVLWPWLVAAVVALIGSWVLPPGWHILVGGLAGGVTGALLHGR